ncbi:MAG: OmpA family protein [Planctomycetia bacterium]|nr:OmpA family protein [Planctomycetia bacterium]
MAHGPRLTTASLPRFVVVVCAVGCTNHPFRSAPSTAPPSVTQPPGTTAFAPTVPPPPSYADADPRQLEAGLVRSRQETQVMQDEIAALREQLASTSAQLAQTRAAGPPGTAMPSAPPGTMAPAAMQAALAGVSLPGIEKRLDGGVARIEVSADRLFEPGTANLLPAGSALLTQVADEVERVYPGHFLGIEGHTDTEPLKHAAWGSQHQLSVARATAVFDFLTSRTSLRQGQLFLVAHGPNHPVVSNATAAGRARNRRIEIVVYPERAADDAASAAHPAAAAGGGG